jgi:hypothetical protein
MNCARALTLVWLLLLVGPPAVAAKGGTIEIDCEIDGATVDIDGKTVGKTPLTGQPAAAGNHDVRIRKLGYLEYTESVTVVSGKTLRVMADLLPFAGVLKVTSNVSGATVSVDGKVIGKVPLEQEIKIGQRLVAVSAPGYSPFTTTLHANPGTPYVIDARLEKGGKAVAAAGGGDDLDLEPLAPLAPIAASPSPHATPKPAAGKGKAAAAGDDLDLEPLVELAAPTSGGSAGGSKTGAGGSKVTTIVAAPLGAMTPPSAEVEGTVIMRKPWYMEYWVWGTAAAVVTGGVTSAVLLSRSSSGSARCTIDMGLTPGVGRFDPCK